MLWKVSVRISVKLEKPDGNLILEVLGQKFISTLRFSFFFFPSLFHARGINIDSPQSVKEHALNCGVGEAVLSFFSLLCFLMERNLEEA